MRILDLLYPGSGMEKFGSRINILDPATLLSMEKGIFVHTTDNRISPKQWDPTEKFNRTIF
jgi:hypothetical protein